MFLSFNHTIVIPSEPLENFEPGSGFQLWDLPENKALILQFLRRWYLSHSLVSRDDLTVKEAHAPSTPSSIQLQDTYTHAAYPMT